MKRHGVVQLAVVAAAVCTVSVSTYQRPSSAHAGTAPDVGAIQQELDEIDDQIDAAGQSDVAYAMVVNDPENATVTVWRAASSPDSVAGRYAPLVPAGVTLKFATALLSASQVSALTQLAVSDATKLLGTDTRIKSWGLDRVGGQFVVRYAGTEPSAAEVAKFTAPFGANVVRFDASSGHTLGRFDDTTPFYGGARVLGPYYPGTTSHENCTSGFGAYGNSNGAHWLTTAWHCFDKHDARFWTYGKTYIGPVTIIDPAHDTVLIKASAAGNSTGPWIFDGPVGYDYQQKQVVGVAGFHSGDFVCTSGSVTKAVCNEQMGVAQGWVLENDYSPSDVATVDGYSVYSRPAGAGPIVATQGDSGGPVFSLVNNNTQAIARGGISYGEGNYQIACPRYVLDQNPNAACYNEVFVINMGVLASQDNLSFSQ